MDLVSVIGINTEGQGRGLGLLVDGDAIDPDQCVCEGI